jgi:FkbM family methyltransferase
MLARWLPAELRKGVDSQLTLAAAIRRVLTPSMNCVDVGAYAGDILKVMVEFAPDGRHFAWEPLPYMASRLRSRFPTVDVRCAALSDRDGETTFIHVKSRPTYSGILPRAYPSIENLEEITVKTQRLDSALPKGYVPHLLKIDVEGAELQVLEGAANTLRRYRPLVFFEHGRGGADYYGTTGGQVYDFLSNCGLRISDVEGSRTYSLEAFEAASDRSDFLAHP